MSNERLHAYVTGRVQGVYFRESTKNVANKLTLHGWVCNLSDGRVELIAEGSRENLEKLLSFIKVGPRSASVIEVEFWFVEPENIFSEFSVVETF